VWAGHPFGCARLIVPEKAEKKQNGVFGYQIGRKLKKE
jgi:hypothetical protein